MPPVTFPGHGVHGTGGAHRDEYQDGYLKTVTYPEGNKSVFTYDARGNVTQTRRIAKRPGSPADIVTSGLYPATCDNPVTCNSPMASIDAAGKRTDYVYDPVHGQLLKAQYPAAHIGGPRPEDRLHYDLVTARILTGPGTVGSAAGGIHRLTSVSRCAQGEGDSCVGQATESRTVLTYDASGGTHNTLPVSVTEQSGDASVAQTTSSRYSPLGDVVEVDGPLPGSADKSFMIYDGVGRLKAAAGPRPAGAAVARRPAQVLTYTDDGNVKRVEYGTVSDTDPVDWAGFTVERRVDRSFDASGRPEWQAFLADGAIQGMTQFSYDAVGRLECVGHRLNPALFTALPASACDIGAEGPDGPNRVSRTYYDAAGQVIRMVSGVGTAAETEVRRNYTANGAPATLTDGRGNMTAYEYDGFDRLSRIRYADLAGAPGAVSTSDVETLAYDASGRVIQSRARDGRVTLYGYDDLGRVEAVDRPGSLPDLAMVYDHLGRRTQVTDGSGNGVGYGFDALGRPVRESRLVAGVERYRVDSRYDAGGRRDRVAHGDGFALTYGWRPDGLPLRVAEEGAVSGPGVLATYGYDAQGRLDRVDRGNGVATSYAYDGSNRLTALGHDAAGTGGDVALGFTYGAAGEILTRAQDNSAYAAPLPAAGDVTGVADALNRLTAVGGVAISHDAAGRVTADGSGVYGYDEAGRLVSVTPSGGAAAVGLSYDVLGRLSRVAVAGQAAVNLAYDGLDVVAELDDAGTILRRYAHGAGADNVLASYEGAGTGNRRWLLADERGSVIADTDGSGAVSGINAYDEYGVPAPGNSGLFQYTGQVRIPGTGLYHYKARAYHPGMGRFLQPDPMGYADGVNLYAYVGNDPVNLVDPLGLEGQANLNLLDEIVISAQRLPDPNIMMARAILERLARKFIEDRLEYIAREYLNHEIQKAEEEIHKVLSEMKNFACGTPAIDRGFGGDFYHGAGASLGAGIKFDLARVQMGAGFSVGVGVGRGIAVGPQTSFSPSGSNFVSANLFVGGGVGYRAAATGQYNLIGTDPGQESISLGKVGTPIAFVNFGFSGGLNTPSIYDFGCRK